MSYPKTFYWLLIVKLYFFLNCNLANINPKLAGLISLGGAEMKNLKARRKNSVFGIFSDQYALERTIEVLKSHHFKNNDISVLMPAQNGAMDLAFKKNTKAPEGASTGVSVGIILGAIFGWLLGNGILTIPGMEPLSEAGALMGAIAGAGVAGTIGGIVGALIGLSIPEYEAQRFENYVTDSNMLITVHVDDPKWERKAKQILKDNGASDVATSFEQKSQKPRYREADLHAMPSSSVSNLGIQSKTELGKEEQSLH